MIYLFAMVFVLSILIFFHELGHFLTAKLFGVRVERFSIGFPPRLFGKKIGDTDYCVSAIPLGGYVKLSGMIDESMDASGLKGEPYEFMSKPLYQKVIIISAGVIMNVILAVVILTAIFWVRGEQILPTTTVGEVVSNGIAQIAGLEKGDKILAINGKPVQTWNDINQQFVANLGDKIDFTVDRGGNERHLIFSGRDAKGKSVDQLGAYPFIPAKVGDLIPGYPAIKSGLKRGDLIVAINGQKVSDWQSMTDIIHGSAGKPVQVEVSRAGKTMTFTIVPKAVVQQDTSGVEKTVGMIGIGYYLETREIDLPQAVVEGVNNTVLVAQLNVKGFSWVLSGRRSAKDVLGGPIMITKLAGDFARTGFLNLLVLVAHLSVILAIINILPIPALDGGHLALILIEGIRRKPLPIKAKMRIQQIGMGFLLILMLFIIFNDLNRLFR